MPIGIVIAVAVVLVIVSAVISHFVTVSNLKKNAESKIGNAENKARDSSGSTNPEVLGTEAFRFHKISLRLL